MKLKEDQEVWVMVCRGSYVDIFSAKVIIPNVTYTAFPNAKLKYDNTEGYYLLKDILPKTPVNYLKLKNRVKKYLKDCLIHQEKLVKTMRKQYEEY